MEWTGEQQVGFLLQSVALGCVQGGLLDIFTGLVHINKHRRWLWTDMAFGPLAAMITFFGSLVIMDGQLHPLLLIGVFAGILMEHLIVGVYICRFVRCARRLLRQMLRVINGFICRFGHILFQWVKIAWCYVAKRKKNVAKP